MDRLRIKEILALIRVKHYIKNLLIFGPLFFGGELFDFNRLIRCVIGFFAFSFLSSVIYIFNDYMDLEKDRLHPYKKERPLASGRVSKLQALIIGIILAVCLLSMIFLLSNFKANLLMLLYFIMNIFYSMGLKRIPIIDIVVLASGFIIRVFYGGFITDIEVSKWLYLVVVTGSLYMGLGKRRNELKRCTGTRDVLEVYNEAFLDKNMYVCVALADVFYALWTLEMSNTYIIYTVPFFVVILMYYSFATECDSDGDPIKVILSNKMLMALIIVYSICLFLLLYILGGRN